MEPEGESSMRKLVRSWLARHRRLAALPAAALSAVVVSTSVAGAVTFPIDLQVHGSTTVFPIMNDFISAPPNGSGLFTPSDTNTTLVQNGSGAGLRELCNDQTDV